MITQIQYKTGCAVNSIESGILCNVCNDIGSWGRGFPKKLSQRWKAPEEQYKYGFKYGNRECAALGSVQFVTVSESPPVIVANLMSVRGKLSRFNPHPFNIEYFRYCIEKVSRKAVELKLPVVFQQLPYEKWSVAENYIKQYLCNSGVTVIVYKNPEKKK